MSVRVHRERATFWDAVRAGPELLERITERRAELDELEERPARHPAEVRSATDGSPWRA